MYNDYNKPIINHKGKNMINLNHLTTTDLHQINADYAQMERTGVLAEDSLLRKEAEKASNGQNGIFIVMCGVVAHTACRKLLYGTPLCP